MINIQNRKPRNELQHYINKISVFKSKGNISYRQKLTPSAYTYLSFNSGNIPTSLFGRTRTQPQNRLQIAGPKNGEQIFVEYNGNLSQILIEFTASGFYYLFHSSPSKIVNKLSDLKNYTCKESYEQLENELSGNFDIQNQIQILEDFLIERLHLSLHFIDYIENALKIIDVRKGHIGIANLLESLNIGKRQFDRKFQEVVGLSPKTYAKIIQLHYVIKLMQSKKYSSMQDISYQAEFYDLAHFTNRFKELTGFTPHEFIKSDKHIALKYFSEN